MSTSPFPDASARDAARIAKREALLIAAARMFNERGFGATSLDDVAATLGVTKPVIYHYLGTKDRVLLECLRMGLSQLTAVANEARRQAGDGRSRLVHFLRRYAEINMTDFGRCVIRTGDELLAAESARHFRALKREVDDALRALLADAQADGSIVLDDPRMTAFVLTGALNWPARWHREDGELPRAVVAKRLVASLMRGIDGRHR